VGCRPVGGSLPRKPLPSILTRSRRCGRSGVPLLDPADPKTKQRYSLENRSASTAAIPALWLRMAIDTSLAPMPATASRGDRSASSGRSIRRSLRLIPTSSTLPQDPPDMRRADPPGADVASCPIRSRRRSGGASAATRVPISASLTAVSVDHGQARGGGRGQYDPASQASGGAAACVSETPPSAAQDARVADGQSS